jgi:predicted phosphoribosyltransferase
MTVHERAELRDRMRVFRDRAHAGEVVAEMTGELRGSETTVLAVPAGGLPVAAVIAGALGLPLDVAVVSKITLPWNTEVGYGAVAFDGTTRLNEALAADLGLADEVVRRGIEETRAKVARRVAELRGEQSAPDLSGRCAVVVDDGLASGFTMATAIEALRRCGASRLLVAVPTGPLRAVERLAPEVDDLYCANVRGGHRFAVADAYEAWQDVGEDEARAIFERFRRSERERVREGRGGRSGI